jgi:hypothetical protein
MSSSIVVRMIKSWMMKWAGHVARMVEKRNAYRWESQRERRETTRKTRT